MPKPTIKVSVPKDMNALSSKSEVPKHSWEDQLDGILAEDPDLDLILHTTKKSKPANINTSNQNSETSTIEKRTPPHNNNTLAALHQVRDRESNLQLE